LQIHVNAIMQREESLCDLQCFCVACPAYGWVLVDFHLLRLYSFPHKGYLKITSLLKIPYVSLDMNMKLRKTM